MEIERRPLAQAKGRARLHFAFELVEPAASS